MITISKSHSMSASSTSNHLYSKPLGRPGVCFYSVTKTHRSLLCSINIINNSVTISFRFPSLQHITSGLSMLIPSYSGNSCFQPYNKDMFSAAS